MNCHHPTSQCHKNVHSEPHQDRHARRSRKIDPKKLCKDDDGCNLHSAADPRNLYYTSKRGKSNEHSCIYYGESGRLWERSQQTPGCPDDHSPFRDAVSENLNRVKAAPRCPHAHRKRKKRALHASSKPFGESRHGLLDSALRTFSKQP